MNHARRLRAACLVLCLATLLSVLLPSCKRETPEEETGNETGNETAPVTYPYESGPTFEDGEGEPPAPGSLSDYEGVRISKVYGPGKKNTDAAVSHGFIELYNASENDISLSGASLYLRSGDGTDYIERHFPAAAVIPAHGFFLVRCASPEGYDVASSVLTLGAYDLSWNTVIDNKSFTVLLAPAGMTIPADADPLTLDTADTLVSGDGLVTCSRTVDGLSKNKMAVRTDLGSTGGFHIVDLTRTAAADLADICPRTSDGRVNPVGTPRLLEVAFSHKAGVYAEAFDLSLSAPAGMTVIYTEDGTDPRDSLTSKTYRVPIEMTDTTAVAWGAAIKMWTRYAGRRAQPDADTLPGGHVIKAYAKAEDGTETAVFTHSYFVGAAFAGYETVIVSISLKAGDMLGRDGFYSNYNPDDDLTATRPRGLAVMEVFDKDGTRVGNSAVELAVSGNGSSGGYMKSLRVYYKGANNTEGDLVSSLNCNLFEGWCKDSEGNDITSFSRLVLRNSGNDCGISYLRDSFMQRMCGGLNVDTLAATPSLVFVNGEFWGVYNIRERYSPEYVEAHYGVDKDNVTLLENDYFYVHTDNNMPFVVASGEEGDEADFNNLVTYIKKHRMSVQSNYDYVAERLDIDSFIDMYACRLFWNARDWPENNIKIWKNKNPDDPSGVDNKWHFTLLDMDMGLAMYSFTDASSSIMDLAFNHNSVIANIAVALRQNPEFEKRLAARCYQLCREVFTAEANNAMLPTLKTQWSRLISLQADRWPGDGADVSDWKDSMKDIAYFFKQRNKRFVAQVRNEFHLTEDQLAALAEKYYG